MTNILRNIPSILTKTLIVLLTLAVFSTSAFAEDQRVREGQDKDELELCNIAEMEKRYMGVDRNGNVDKERACWYCRIVIIMTNAYLQAANQALPVSQELGHMLLKLGFSIWLAIYILKQISAFSATSPGKMLQEIFVMGCKCMFANLAISDGITFITDFILNPIMITGTDIGSTLLDQLLAQILNV